MTLQADGIWHPRFGPVVDQFLKNFTHRGEVGAALSVTIEGSLEIDICAGWADVEREEPWRHDTLVNIYSAAKPVVAVNLLRLIDRGLIALDDPIVSVWPEFGAHGKHLATFRQALCHRAGVPAIRRDLTNDDLWEWNVMCDALAASEPYFEPGSLHVYHTNTYGHLIGEITRRITGDLPAAALATVCNTLKADLHVGLSSDDQRRCATVNLDVAVAASTARAPSLPSPDEETSNMVARGYFNPPGLLLLRCH